MNYQDPEPAFVSKEVVNKMSYTVVIESFGNPDKVHHDTHKALRGALWEAFGERASITFEGPLTDACRDAVPQVPVRSARYDSNRDRNGRAS